MFERYDEFHGQEGSNAVFATKDHAIKKNKGHVITPFHFL